MRELLKNSVYIHYKGKLYYVVGEAFHSDNMQEMVVYQAMYGDDELWVRPKEEFLSLVEDGVENPTNQKYRFEQYRH